MILGIGTDIVQIDRMIRLTKLPQKRLLTFFSKAELAAAQDPYNQDCYLPEKLATRFAAKEALYKALSASLNHLAIIDQFFPLRFLAQQSSMETTHWGVPFFKIDWHNLEQKLNTTLPGIQVHVSVSHEQGYALAFVTCEQKNTTISTQPS